MAAPNEAPAALALPARLDTAAATTLHGNLLALRGQDIRLEAAGVEQVGGLCLQVLLAAAAAWAEDGRALELDQPSAALASGMKRFGLQTLTNPIGEMAS